MIRNSIKYMTVALASACVVTGFAGCAPKDNNTEASSAAETSTETQATSEETRYTHAQETTVYETGSVQETSQESHASTDIVESGSYTSMAEVSAYINEYGHLPDNYITKKEAKKLGWKSDGKDLTMVAPGKSIGGDPFGNREGVLPKKKGRKYYECDIDYTGGERNAKRLVYSNDGLIYYTEDHYNTFELLYGEE